MTRSLLPNRLTVKSKIENFSAKKVQKSFRSLRRLISFYRLKMTSRKQSYTVTF